MKHFKKQEGQVIIVLLLTMLAALTIGLAITQRSLTDVSTSTQSEQSSRAFSAAEAGIERALSSPIPVTITEGELGNQAKADIRIANDLPRARQALEYPPVGKETIAQFWLTNPDDPLNPSDPNAYPNSRVAIYFGNEDLTLDGSLASLDTPAISISLVTAKRDSTRALTIHRFFYDPVFNPSQGRRDANGFTNPGCQNTFPAKINTTNSENTAEADPTKIDRQFRCRVVVTNPVHSTDFMVLMRIRILYSTTNQRLATEPMDGFSLPPQASIYTSIGNAGQSQKVLQLFRLKNVSPPFLDFSIFSAGDIRKN